MNLGGRFFDGDSNAARGAIIDALLSSRTRGDFKQQDATEEEERYIEAVEQQREQWYYENYHMTYEEYLQYREIVLPELLRKYANFAPDILYPQFVASFEDAYAAEHSQTNNTENNEQQRNDTTAEEPTTTPGDTVLQTEETNNSRGDSQSKEQPTEVPTGVRSSNENGTLPQSAPTKVDKEPQPIGNSFFGKVYNQFKGKAKEAVNFLMRHKSGKLLGVFHRNDIGEISLVWGDEKGGLAHIISKHIVEQNDFNNIDEVINTMQQVINNGTITRENKDKVVIDYNDYRVAIRKQTRDNNGNVVEQGNWIVTAFDKSRSKKDKTPSEKTLSTPPFNQETDGVTLPSNGVTADKVTQSSQTKETKEDKFSPTPRKDGESITDYAERVAEEHQAQRTRKEEEAKVDTNPTEAQKEAGNYKKGHIKVDGLNITIEQPKGSIRRGTDANGKQWESEMHNTYGYIRGTESVDGDHIDIFLSDNPTEGNVFVVDQINKDGSFDEHKVMYGFSDMESARQAYLSNYEEGWQGLGSITEVKKEDFKKWIDSSKRKTKPFAEYTSVKTQDDVQTKKPTEENAAPAKTQTEENNAHNSEDIMHEQKNVQLQQAINAYENATKFYYQQLKEGTLDKVFESKQWKDVLRKQTELQKVLLQLNSEELKELLKQTTNEDTKKEIKGALDAVLRQEQRSIEYNAVLDKQEPITPIYKEEKNPIAVTEFVETDKKEAEIHPVLTGVYHDNGYVVGTNAHILLARKEDYNKSLEGKITNKKGEVIDGKYPNWRAVVEGETTTNSWGINLDELHAFVRGVFTKLKADGAKKSTIDSATIAFKDTDGNIIVCNAKTLDKALRGAKSIGATEFGNKSERFAHAQTKKGYVVCPTISTYHSINDNCFVYAPKEAARQQTTATLTNDTEAKQKATEAVLAALSKAGIEVVRATDEEVKALLSNSHATTLRTPQGTIYGWSLNGKIYLTEAGINPDTPIHEYTHLWADAMMKQNKQGWDSIKSLLKDTPVWKEVIADPNYSNIKDNEDAVASEVLSRISGKKNAAKMEEEAQRAIDEAKGVFEKAEAATVLLNLKRALKQFWHWVGKNVFDIKDFKNIDEVTDRVLYDLLSNTKLNSGTVTTVDGVSLPSRINVVEAEANHGFKNFDDGRKWAKENIARTYDNEETNGKGNIRISNTAIDKFMSEKAVAKSESKDVHMAVLKVLPDIIRESVDAEQHEDRIKDENGIRKAGNTVNPDVMIHRLYGAVDIAGKIYRVKVTLKENVRTKETSKAYSYEATKIELLSGQSGDVTMTSPRNDNNSILTAKLLKDIEKSYGKGVKLLKDDKSSDPRFQIVGNSLSDEEKKIVETAKANDTYMKAPNGKPTNLSEKQWTQVRTTAFKNWFGDWEKAARIEKVRRSKAVVISGSEYKDKYELNRDSAKEWIKDNLRGEYTIADTEEIVSLTKVGANKVTSHGMSNKAHLQSIAAIPQLIRHAIFIEERPNEKHNNKYDSYKYYICGLKIGTTDYTVKLTIGVKSGKKYYDHALTEIEKGKLLDRINDQADKKGFTTTGDAPLQSYALSIGKDSKLLSILQTNSSKVVDENGEPMVVYHGTLADGLRQFSTDFIGSRYSYDEKGFFFISNRKIADDYAVSEFDASRRGEVIDAYVSLGNPLVVNSEWCRKNGLGSNVFKDNDVIEFWDNYQSLIVEESEQNDGVIVTDGETSMVVAFFPNQIKSATGNNGNFSTTEDDILYRTVFGGNSGYVGYSMSKRAAEAKEEDRGTNTEPTTNTEELTNHAESVVQNLHLNNVEIVPDGSSLNGEQATAKGFYNKRTGKIVVVAGNHTDIADIEKTVLHEAVAHHGLRELFGDNFDNFLDTVFAKADIETRRQIAHLSAKHGWNIRTATEEYLASMAEDTNFEQIKPTLWQRIKQLFGEIMSAFGLHHANITDNDLRYILWRSYKNLQGGGRRSILDKAEDIAMQYRLKVGNYTDKFTDELNAVNERFNEELSNLTEENADKVTLWLGKPSKVLLAAGVEDKPMKLYGNKVIKKMKKHGFAFEELQDLPKAVSNPIAVFNNYQREGNRTILTELRSQGKNIMVAVTLGKNGVDVDFNIVSSVFGKGSTNIVDWINKGYLAYVDKEKALNYLYFSERNISEATENSELSSAAKIIKDFHNPKLNSNVLYRSSIDPTATEVLPDARTRYEKETKEPDEIGSVPKTHNFFRRFYKSYVDSMLALKSFTNSVLEATGDKMSSHEDTYKAENAMTSKNKTDGDVYNPLFPYMPLYLYM